MKDNGEEWKSLHLLLNTMCRMKFITLKENSAIRIGDLRKVIRRIDEVPRSK